MLQGVNLPPCHQGVHGTSQFLFFFFFFVHFASQSVIRYNVCLWWLEFGQLCLLFLVSFLFPFFMTQDARQMMSTAFHIIQYLRLYAELFMFAILIIGEKNHLMVFLSLATDGCFNFQGGDFAKGNGEFTQLVLYFTIFYFFSF